MTAHHQTSASATGEALAGVEHDPAGTQAPLGTDADLSPAPGVPAGPRRVRDRRGTGTLADNLARFMARSKRDGACLIGPQQGYGEITWAGGRITAHRASYIVFNGPIPSDLMVRHTCDRVGCIEPTHLLVGTAADNLRDASERNRLLTGESHPHHRATSAQVAEAVSAYLAGGQSQAEVARHYGVSQSTLGRWVRGRYRADSGLPPVSVGAGRRTVARPLQPCGTNAAWQQHRLGGEEPCAPCIEAHRAYERARAARRRADLRASA